MIRTCFVVAAISFATLILIATPASANELLDELKDAVDRVELGAGGYTGAINPIIEPIELRFDHHEPAQLSIDYLIGVKFGEAEDPYRAAIRWQLSTSVEVLETGSDKLAVTVDIEDVFTDVSTSTSARGSRRVHAPEFPVGASVQSFLSANGRTKSQSTIPPDGFSVEDLDQESLKLVSLAVDKLIPIELASARGVQDEAVFVSYFQRLIEKSGFRRTGGAPPLLRGTVPCGDATCLLVEFGETAVRDEITNTVRGHLLLEIPSLRTRSGIILEHDRTVVDDAVSTTDTLFVIKNVE